MHRKRKNPNFKNQAREILHGLDFNYLTSGGEGEIYEFKKGNKKYILKILDPEYATPYNKRIQKYLLELSDLKLIPKIHEINENYVIMDFVRGSTLKKLKNSLTIPQLNSIFRKITKFTEKWHNLGYGHGDLNSTNIMIDEEFNIYFIDPGIDSLNETIENDFLRLNLLEYDLFGD